MTYFEEMRQSLTYALEGGVGLALLCLAACGLNNGGGAAGTDGGASPDVGAPDAGHEVDAGRDAGDTGAEAAAEAGCGSTDLMCNGACVSTCEGCAAGGALCLATRVCGHCSNCAGSELECFTCGPDGGAKASSFCGNPAVGCGSAPRCLCNSGDPSDCPGKTQVCATGGTKECLTCGEIGTDNKDCKGGKKCAQSDTPPVCK